MATLAGVIAFSLSPGIAHEDHRHWHLLDFDRYSLLTRGGRVVVRDHRAGFCLGDHYGTAPAKPAHRARRPVHVSNCDVDRTGARSLEEGLSVGFTDRYPANYEGRFLDLTGVAAGTPEPAPARVPLRRRRARCSSGSPWPHGRGQAPTVTALRRCDSARCG